MGDAGYLMQHLELALGGSKGRLPPFYILYCALGRTSTVEKHGTDHPSPRGAPHLAGEPGLREQGHGAWVPFPGCA